MMYWEYSSGQALNSAASQTDSLELKKAPYLDTRFFQPFAEYGVIVIGTGLCGVTFNKH